MKVEIEIWQSKFNGEWNCNIRTIKENDDSTEYWAVENFCDLLNMICEKIPNAKCVAKPKED